MSTFANTVSRINELFLNEDYVQMYNVIKSEIILKPKDLIAAVDAKIPGLGREHFYLTDKWLRHGRNIYSGPKHHVVMDDIMATKADDGSIDMMLLLHCAAIFIHFAGYDSDKSDESYCTLADFILVFIRSTYRSNEALVAFVDMHMSPIARYGIGAVEDSTAEFTFDIHEFLSACGNYVNMTYDESMSTMIRLFEAPNDNYEYIVMVQEEIPRRNWAWVTYPNGYDQLVKYANSGTNMRFSVISVLATMYPLLTIRDFLDVNNKKDIRAIVDGLNRYFSKRSDFFVSKKLPMIFPDDLKMLPAEDLAKIRYTEIRAILEAYATAGFCLKDTLDAFTKMENISENHIKAAQNVVDRS